MGWVAAVGAFLQLTLLIFQKWIQWGDEKKKERKALYEEGKKAIADRDVSSINAIIQRINRM